MPKSGFKVELYGNANTRLPETIKMFLVIHQANLPITIAEPDNIRKRLLGQGNVGIIPIYDSLYQANQFFREEEGVFDVVYYEDLEKYKSQLAPFIRWETLPILRPRYF
ncbi:MAG: hypothetical protein AAF960_06675 [Bacteroidota bacterium]